ncbi:uncharacterized protein LOC130216606 [Danio aesculapii]|uniref:uncharacterized protein LOC130216606 n=1 Tax=Danio aesculapii TaxID=1142201 RepID=UPI0024C06842|nr:uncharacterized protein LOC130216606 [Danio aesculapii]
MFRMFALCLCWWCLTGVFGESVSVTEGDSITLNTDTQILKVDIQWKFGAENSIIAKIKLKLQIFSTIDNTLNGRFRDRLKLDNQTGSLTIMNIRSEHAGDYKVLITGEKLTTKSFSVSVYARLPVPVLIFNSSQCSSSVQYCSVLCSVVNVSAVSLSWYKGNSLLSSISVSDLSISLSLPLEVEYQDNNTYSCVINNTISNHTTHLDIHTLCELYEGHPGSLLVLISAAGSLLIISAVGIFYICRKHRKTDQEVEIQSEITYAETVFSKRRVYKSIKTYNLRSAQYKEMFCHLMLILRRI